jgi:hypothetical protein
MIHACLLGALSASSLVAGLFFLKFWKVSRDRLFLIFACAFWTLSLNWLILAVGEPEQETRHYYYLVRLAAFLLLIVGIIDKNRRD